MLFFISHLIETPYFLQLLKHYPTLGIETINFSISSILDEGTPAITRYENELEGILSDRPLTLHGPFFDLSPASFDSQIKAVTLNRFMTACKIAQQLSAKKIIFHSGFIPQVYYTEGWLQNSILFWKEFMPHCPHDLTICIENVFETDYRPIKQLLEAVSHPRLKFCLDIGHVNAYSTLPLDDWIIELGPYIDHVHLHNNDGTKDQHNGLLRGSLSIKDCLMQLNDVAPTATITLEIYDQKELLDSLNYLTSLNLL